MSYPDPYMQGFMQALASETKGVFVRHLFVDINDGYLSDSIAFSQITYIFSVSNQDCTHNKIVEKDGVQWLSLSHSDWWEACRLNKNTVKAVIKRIVDRGLVKTIRARIGDGNQVRTLIRPDYEKISDTIKAMRSDRNDLTVGSKRSDGSDRNDLTVGSKRSDGSDRNDLTVGSKRSTPPYIENLKDLEEDQERSPERGREANHELSSSRTIELSTAEDFGGRSDFVVQQAKISALTRDDRREDQIAAAPEISQDWNYSAMGPIDVVSVVAVVTTDELYTASQYIDVASNGFEGFRAVYEELCDNVDGRFGSVEVARESWRVAWRGLEPPEDFWTGLTLYCNQQKNEFLRTGKCWTLGVKRFLEDEKWRSALRIGARDQRAAAQGVDFHNPELLKKEALIASNRRNGELARLSLIEKGFLTA